MYTRQQLAVASCNLGPCPEAPRDMHCPAKAWNAFAAGPWTIRDRPYGKYSVTTATTELVVAIGAYYQRGCTFLCATLRCDGHAVGCCTLGIANGSGPDTRHSLRDVLRWLFDALAAAGAPDSNQKLLRAHFRL